MKNLQSELPELYKQRSTILNNPWHDHQSVFDHTLAVMNSLETIAQLPGVAAFLNTQVEGVFWKQIVSTVALLHDVGCASTWVTDSKTDLTDCPGHEKASGDMSRVICKRWKMSESLTQKISWLVYHHLDIHHAINRIIETHDEKRIFTALQKTSKNLYLPLLIQGYADTMGSDLKTLNPNDYSIREKMYQKEITRFAASGQ
jgi:hypothetical protein